jgi:hypothetical protein
VAAAAFPAKCDPTIAGDGVVSIVAGNTIARALRQQLDFMTWHTQYINGLAEKRPQLVALLPLSDVPVLRTVIDAPYEIQLSLLVVLMGCLGGMISVIRCYVDASLPDPSVGEFFYRPAIGALVALGIYVLFKAGQLMLGASTPGSGGEAGTGAFLAAFLGIISGLSARDAIGAIDAAASRMWQRGNFVYVYKIADDKISDAERGGLLKLLGIDGDTWKVWLAGRTPIPRATAQRVADYLRLDMRDIFTAELV